ncbi:5-methylcytosine rRNA methyltransferase NSUN4 isoform X3 [Clupea harengus]|uniref:5-cytosine rRNA methyltransferase NSUN4 n=1 Tax=Clupea harengus TaxID=7950 RepID=A0A8M1K7V1_CLUHA|nr:5-methylcytosine rRNA methyltransferase NSUN4 isoform X3 [Clupea harengus]
MGKAATSPKLSATDLALQNHDVMYNMQLGELWPSVRVGLLTEQKYGALVNNFSCDDTVMYLQSLGCQDFIASSLHMEGSKAADSVIPPYSESLQFDQPIEGTYTDLTRASISPNVKCFVFPKGDISRFKPARPDSCGYLSYYLMDAASVLPVLALNVQKGQSVLDLCAAPGGKTLALLQTQAIRFLWANDWSGSRMSRLQRTLKSCLPSELCSEDNLCITSLDGRKWQEVGENGTFDKVLVDVPCTTDRHSLVEEDNNIFSRSRTKEKQSLPLCQTQLLLSALQAVRVGGEVMYSTCTLSQLQNQCVVEQAMSLAKEELGISAEVVDLQPFTALFQDTFYFAPDMNVGVMVLPHLTANFGPIYFCKLRRLS